MERTTPHINNISEGFIIQLKNSWLYFRTGYSYYFVFLISGLNALMIAYFVVILGSDCSAGESLNDQGKILCAIRFMFPHFGYFVLFAIGAGVPLLMTVGYIHYKKHQLGTHAFIEWHKNPYQKITFELYLEMISELKERNKFNEGKLKRLNVLEANIRRLMGGIDEDN